MGMLRNKRGIELSMNVIIIAIILIVVLVVMLLFFTGGASNAIKRFFGIYATQTIDTSQAILKCNSYCSNYEITKLNVWQKNFCGENQDSRFDIDTNGDGKADRTGITCIDLGISCPSMQCGA